MTISIAFSFGIYRLMTAELDRFEDMQQRKIDVRMQYDPYIRELPSGAKDILRERMFDSEIINEAKMRIQLVLMFINIAILAGSAAAGYFLAGKTLRPIQLMVDEQNRFITDSSHELRTPLTALRSEMEVTLRDKNLKLKDAKEIIESNLEEVIAIQSLTDNLLKLTKSFSPQNKRIEDIDVKALIEEAVKKVLPMAKKKDIKIETESEVSIINVNRSEMIELLIIFIDNAIKYSPNNSNIYVNSKRKGHDVVVKIKDEGIGIEQNDLPHLFDRFYRADKSRSKNDSDGFGLGLSIAKRIVDGYNGRIEVESEIEKGSTFIIILPLKKSAQLNKIKLFS
jgi:two-component system, OmpR family, sensor histidine kinase CiaH